MPNKIYEFLKENNLTTKDEDSFEKEYSDPKKSEELHSFMSQNGLTTKGKDDFYNEYFIKKKEEAISEDSSTPAPSPLQPSKKSGELPSNILEATGTAQVGLTKGGEKGLSDQEIQAQRKADAIAKQQGKPTGALQQDVVIEEPKTIAQIAPPRDIKKEEDPSFVQSVKNTTKNVVNTLQGAVPRLNVVSADVWEGLLGKEIASKFYEYDPVAKRDIAKVRDNAYENLRSLQKEVLPTRGVVESIKKKDMSGVAASVIDATSSILATGFTSAITGGAGLFTESIGEAIVSHNEEKAKSLGVSTKQLYESGNASIRTPVVIGTISGALESVGLKGVSKFIDKKIGSNIGKEVLKGFGDFNKEGMTEVAQLGLDTFNKSIANGKTISESSSDAADAIFSKEGLEVYAKGAIGSAVSGLAGRGIKNVTKTTSQEELDTPRPPSDFEEKVSNTTKNGLKNLKDLIVSPKTNTINAEPRQETAQVPDETANVPRTPEPVVPKGDGDNGVIEQNTPEPQKETFVTPKPKDKVKVPMTISGITSDRNMVFDEGQWKQDVGGELTKVGLPLQELAQSYYNKSSKTPSLDNSVNELIVTGASSDAIANITANAEDIAKEAINSGTTDEIKQQTIKLKQKLETGEYNDYILSINDNNQLTDQQIEEVRFLASQKQNTPLSEHIYNVISKKDGSPITPIAPEDRQDNGSRIPASNEGSPTVPKGNEGAKPELGQTKNVNPALRDVESTAKALVTEFKKGGKVDEDGYQYRNEKKVLPVAAAFTKEMNDRYEQEVFEDELKTAEQFVSEAYHKAKKDGSNPELVKAVESLLSKEQPINEESATEGEQEAETTTTGGTKPTPQSLGSELEVKSEQPAVQKPPSTKEIIADIVSKWNIAQELQGAEKTQAMRAYKEAVNSDSKIKSIFENLNAINKALGVEKSDVKCP